MESDNWKGEAFQSQVETSGFLAILVAHKIYSQELKEFDYCNLRALLFFWAGSHCVALAGLELAM